MLSRKPWQSEFVLLFGAAMFACYGFVAMLALLLQKSGLTGFHCEPNIALERGLSN